MELGAAEESGTVGGLNLREEGAEPGCLLIAPSPSPRRGVPGRGLPRQLGVRVHGGPGRPQGQPPGQVLGEWAVAPARAATPHLWGAKLTNFLPQGSTASTSTRLYPDHLKES